MTGLVEKFLDGLRAGEPHAVAAANRLLGTMAHKHPPERLTPRQEEMLRLVATGWSDGEIALEMGIQRETVKKHVLDAKYRLGARTRPHAVVLWLATQRG